MIEIWEAAPDRKYPSLYLDHRSGNETDIGRLNERLRATEPLANDWEPLGVYISDVALPRPDIFEGIGPGFTPAMTTAVREAMESECHPFGWLEFLPLVDADTGETYWMTHFLAWPNVVDDTASTYVTRAGGHLETLAIAEFHSERVAHQTLFPIAQGRDAKTYRTCAATDSADPDTDSFVKPMLEARGFTGIEWRRIWDDTNGGVLLDERYRRHLP